MSTPAPQPAEAGATPATPARPQLPATSLLLKENFATRFAKGDLRERDAMHLHALLARLTPDLSAPAFAEWLEDLFHWLQAPRALPEQRPDEPPAAARVRTLLEAVEQLPEQHLWVRLGVARLFGRSHAVTLFTDVGVPSRCSASPWPASSRR